jgi:GT2 family glycosyltransferase
MNEPVSIIILNYNGKIFLKDCITSVLAQTYPEFELIFYDNNSSDGSVKFIRESFHDRRIKVIESHKNLGFAGGNNEAIKHAENDLIVLLNNDTTVEKDWLEKLVNAVSEKNTIASSFVITEGINPKYYETNGSVSYVMNNIMNIFPDIEDEFYPNGCSAIFRKSEITEPFDSDYFFYSEDLYLGLKARFMGMNIRFVKDSIVHHAGSGSGSSSALKTFYRERNRMLNLYIFFSFLFILKISPIIFMTNCGKFLISVFSRKVSLTGFIKAHFWFYLNILLILKKRREIRKIKRVNEKEVVKFMTSRLLNHELLVNRMCNKLSYIYSRLMWIKPFEYYS